MNFLLTTGKLPLYVIPYYTESVVCALLGDRTKRRLSFLINFVFWAVWVAILLFAGRFVLRFMLPFAAAYVVAALLQRPVCFLQNHFRFTHTFAVTTVCIITLTAVGALLGFGGYHGGKLLWGILQRDETTSILQSCSNGVRAALQTILQRLSDFLPANLQQPVAQAITALEQAVLQSSAKALAGFSGDMLSFLTGALPRFLLSLLFFVLSLLFFTKDFYKVRRFIYRQIPPPQRPLTKAAVNALRENTVCIVRAYVILGTVTFVQTAVGFYLLRLPMPLVWALLTTLVDALPILGVGAVLLPAALFMFALGNVGGGIGLLVLYAVCTITRQLLQPSLVSKETGLPPLLTLLTMYVGFRVAGILGLLSFPILSMVILQLQKENYLHIFK